MGRTLDELGGRWSRVRRDSAPPPSLFRHRLDQGVIKLVLVGLQRIGRPAARCHELCQPPEPGVS